MEEDGDLSDPPAVLPSPGRGLLYLLSGLPRRLDPDFVSWCDRHHREVLAIPGILRARRLARVGDREEPDRYLTCYDLADPGVIDSDAFRSHGDHGTPMPEEIRRSISFERLVLRVTALVGTLGHCDHVVRVTWSPRGGPNPEEAVEQWWPPLRDRGLASGVAVAIACDGPDVAVALFECDGEAARRLEDGDSATGVPPGIVYRLQFEAHSEGEG